MYTVLTIENLTSGVRVAILTRTVRERRFVRRWRILPARVDPTHKTEFPAGTVCRETFRDFES